MARSKTVSLAQYKRQQAKLGAKVGARALSLLRPLHGETVSKSDLVRVAREVLPAVREERRAAAELGHVFYLSQRLAMLDEPDPGLVAPYEPYGITNLVTGLSSFVRPGEKFSADVEAASLVARHVKSAARREVTGLSLVDAQCAGWARTSAGTTSCSFCLMLISRGPVYRSRESAGDMKTFHNRCDCVVVPVFDKKRFPGRDEWLSAQDVWNSATRGKSGKEALKAFRDHLSSSAPGGQDATTVA